MSTGADQAQFVALNPVDQQPIGLNLGITVAVPFAFHGWSWGRGSLSPSLSADPRTPPGPSAHVASSGDAHRMTLREFRNLL